MSDVDAAISPQPRCGGSVPTEQAASEDKESGRRSRPLRRSKLMYVVKYIRRESPDEQVEAAEERLVDALAALLDDPS